MQKIQQLMGSLRQSDGTYERFTCEDAGGEPHEVFASTDKSPAMVRREWGLKKMRNVISQMADHLKLYADKTKGEVSCQWKPLAKLVPQPGGSPPVLSYADANIRSLGLGPVVLRQKLLDAFAS